MPIAVTDDQVPHDPRGGRKFYNVQKSAGHIIGILDYGYLNSFKIEDGPASDGSCLISSDTKKNGDVWICPNAQRPLRQFQSVGSELRIGMFLANARRQKDKNNMYDYNFFRADVKKPYHVPGYLPVSLDICPMMAEMCANTCMIGAKDDPQSPYRKKHYLPAPHDNSYVVAFMDGHAEIFPAENTKDKNKKRFLNWQPFDENDKYYAPYGPRPQEN